MGGLKVEDVLALFGRFGENWPSPLTIDLIGGSALTLLGNSRTTVDIDYVGSDIHPESWQDALGRLASEMRLEIEAVPLAEMIPLPAGAMERCRIIGQFGNVIVRVFDPCSIALSKLDRGTNTDLEDVMFLLRQGFITGDALSEAVMQTLPVAAKYDISERELRRNHATLMRMRSEL